MTMEAWTIAVTVALAFVGYLATFLLQRHDALVRATHERVLDNRRAQLERVNLQLRNLYGPLYTTLLANQAIWEQFVRRHWPAHGGTSYFIADQTTDAENETWRRWMTEVFEPLNTRIETAILNNGDLLEGNRLPPEFVEALAHIAAYRALYPRWQAGDFSEHASLINYPASLIQVVEPVYQELLKRQQQLSV